MRGLIELHDRPRRWSPRRPRPPRRRRAVALSVANLGGAGGCTIFRSICGEGEILGVVGLADAGAGKQVAEGARIGRRAARRAVVGRRDRSRCAIAVRRLARSDSRSRRANAAPKGCFSTHDIARNIVLPHLRRLSAPRPFLDRPRRTRGRSRLSRYASRAEADRAAAEGAAAQRRQSAEGDVRARGRRQPRASCCSTSLPAASTSARNSTSTLCCANLAARRGRSFVVSSITRNCSRFDFRIAILREGGLRQIVPTHATAHARRRLLTRAMASQRS